ncbi:MAG: hypothetical protein PHI08_05105 [Bacteroidales bacterium]|nr:hypothetical protein [Bacteroidales bacterium]
MNNKKSIYSGISNLEELRRAQRKLSDAIDEKSNELSLDYKEFKRIINPLTYIDSVVERVKRAGNFAGNVMRFFYAVKDAVNTSKKSVEDTAQETDSQASQQSESTVPGEGENNNPAAG